MEKNLTGHSQKQGHKYYAHITKLNQQSSYLMNPYLKLKTVTIINYSLRKK